MDFEKIIISQAFYRVPEDDDIVYVRASKLGKYLKTIVDKSFPVELPVMLNFADLVDLLTDIEKHLDELYELAVIPEHLVSTYGNSQMNIGQRITELKSKISA